MHDFEIKNQNIVSPKYGPIAIIAIYLLLMIMSLLIGSGVMVLVGLAKGLNLSDVMSALQNGGASKDIGFIQMIVAINQLSMFIIPALITFLIVDRYQWPINYSLHRSPNFIYVILGILTIICSVGLVAYSMEVNKMIPLPTWMKSMNSSAEALINSLVQDKNIFRFIINIILIGIIPGVGEELVFRGIIQTNCYKIFNNPHIAIWATAILFSAMHLQFDGFLPRMILGAILGYIFYFSKNLWVSMAAHAFNNSIALISFTFLKGSNLNFDPEDTTNATWYFGLISLILVLLLLFNIRKIQLNEKFEN